MTPGEVRRLYFITRIFLSYGLDEPTPKVRITLLLRLWRYSLFWMPNRHKDRPLDKRPRPALQELGPVWIKFGQMLSTHRDLFPPHIVDQLVLLQDKVVPFDGKPAKQQIEAVMGGLPVKVWFDDFKIKSLVLASTAQVHTARLKPDDKEVMIKVAHLGILLVIKADLKLTYRLTYWVPRLLPDGCRLRSIEVVREYGRTSIDELNLLQGSADAIQLRHNFEDSPMLYIPEVYPDYCSKGMMVMRRIYGIPVSDVATLGKNGTNMKLLAERGVQVLFAQVSHDSLSHADIHSGNIFVSYEHLENLKYTDIDCGIIGSLDKEDKHYLAENFIAFFNRDHRKVAELHVDSGWVLPDTSVEEFGFAIHTVCEPIFKKPPTETPFGYVLLNLFSTARRFSMEVQPQLVLFQRALSYVGGVGCQLYPQLDLWKMAKPFLKLWIKDQVGIPALVRAFKEKVSLRVEKIPELPELVYNSLRQGKYSQHSVGKVARELQSNHVRQRRSRYFLGIGATLVLSGTLLLASRSERGLTPGWLMAGGLIAWFAGWRKTRRFFHRSRRAV